MAGGGFDVPALQIPHVNSGNIQSPGLAEIQYFGRDSEDQRNMPWLTPVLAITHVIVFIMTMRHNNCPANLPLEGRCILPLLRGFAFQPLTENPLLGASANKLLELGALESELVTKAHEGWRLVCSLWLQAGLFHLVGNLLGVLVIGIPLERRLGYMKVTLTYITSGFAGNVLSALFVHGRVSVGASGAFMGLLGATMSSILINWKLYPRRTPSLVAVIFFGAINLAFGLMPLVDNFMHIGGATTGFLLGNLLMIRPEFGWITRRCFPAIIYDTDDMPIKSTKHAILKNAMWIISLILFLSAITAGLLALFQEMDVEKGCSWCKYMMCVPTHLWKCYGNQEMGCFPLSYQGYLRIMCANNVTHDWPAVANFDPTTPQVQGLCIKSCV
ncbi:hypothetical protein CY35_01G113200 [Sphagnum magellanicum]|nr:hypothetical protein CY35_01G113200 [Sphagnum magellanicum]